MQDIETDQELELIPKLIPGGRTELKLEHNGYLLLEHDIPFLIIYRNIPDDRGTIRLAKSGASFLITGKGDFSYFQEIIDQLTERMSDRFGSYIFIEIYAGEKDSERFIIRGPSHKLSVSLQVLQKELEKIANEKYPNQFLEAKIEQTRERLNPTEKSFLEIEDCKNRGCTFIGLEIPPVFRDASGEIFPIYFKKFRNGFTQALQKAVFDFIRIQTPSDINSFAALGKRKIQKELFEIDRGLTRIQNSYQFLLLVAPVNIQQIREEFFNSDFENVNTYHYRLLPIDPDLLKRELYNLRIDEIDDPALAYLYEEKREEIDQELTMLKGRGSKNFFYSSLRLYKGIEKKIIREAKLILENIPEEGDQEQKKEIDAHDFAEMAYREFDYFRTQAPDFKSRVHIREDVNIIMVSRGELYIPADYKMTREEAVGILQHEIGTHALTFYNGSRQPLTQLSQGLADYDTLQEGLAMLSEYLMGSLTKNRLRHLAGRVLAGEALLNDADFKEIFHLLHNTHGFSKFPAFNITSRMFQGSGFIKDIVYLRGLVELKEYLEHHGDLKFLLSGKFALSQVPLIKELTERKLLHPPKLIPRYFESDGFEERMAALRKGISLSDMPINI